MAFIQQMNIAALFCTVSVRVLIVNVMFHCLHPEGLSRPVERSKSSVQNTGWSEGVGPP